jgi:hypothetical protein
MIDRQVLSNSPIYIIHRTKGGIYFEGYLYDLSNEGRIKEIRKRRNASTIKEC